MSHSRMVQSGVPVVNIAQVCINLNHSCYPFGENLRWEQFTKDGRQGLRTKGYPLTTPFLYSLATLIIVHQFVRQGGVMQVPAEMGRYTRKEWIKCQ